MMDFPLEIWGVILTIKPKSHVLATCRMLWNSTTKDLQIPHENASLPTRDWAYYTNYRIPSSTMMAKYKCSRIPRNYWSTSFMLSLTLIQYPDAFDILQYQTEEDLMSLAIFANSRDIKPKIVHTIWDKLTMENKYVLLDNCTYMIGDFSINLTYDELSSLKYDDSRNVWFWGRVYDHVKYIDDIDVPLPRTLLEIVRLVPNRAMDQQVDLYRLILQTDSINSVRRLFQMLRPDAKLRLLVDRLSPEKRAVLPDWVTKN